MADNTGHKLYGIWKKKFREYNGYDYVGSMYRDAAMLKNVSSDIGLQTIIDIMQYYFDSRESHDFNYFIFEYPSILQDMELFQKDQDRRDKIRRRTIERLKERGVEIIEQNGISVIADYTERNED